MFKLEKKTNILKKISDVRMGRLFSVRLEESSGPRTEGVPNNNQRGQGSRSCRHLGGLLGDPCGNRNCNSNFGRLLQFRLPQTRCIVQSP